MLYPNPLHEKVMDEHKKTEANEQHTFSCYPRKELDSHKQVRKWQVTSINNNPKQRQAMVIENLNKSYILPFSDYK